MANSQPLISNIKGTRRFVCSAVVPQAVIVNSEEKIRLLSSLTRSLDSAWQVVSGAQEAGETV